MKLEIEVRKPWPYRHPKRGRQVLEPGHYIAPDQIDEKVARRAIDEGMARRIVRPVEELAEFAAIEVPEYAVTLDDAGAVASVKKKRGRPRKLPQLETKPLYVAENK